MAIRVYELVGSDPARPFSPHCWKAVMALAHKGLPIDRVPAAFTAVPSVEGGASKTVPLINDGGTVVADSFAIAEYLEDTYPDRPSLFGGAGGRAMSRFIESWTQNMLHSFLGQALLMDIHDRLAPEDQAHFRKTREARFGKTLEDVPVGRQDKLADFRTRLEPLRITLSRQPFLGGEAPLFADYIVFGAFQWARVISSFPLLEEGDPVNGWFNRCLDLHGGIGRQTPACNG